MGILQAQKRGETATKIFNKNHDRTLFFAGHFSMQISSLALLLS
jgi:hypothetical protein